MRLAYALMIALVALPLALPAAAQQLSPLTGTTASPGPGAAPPGAPPTMAPAETTPGPPLAQQARKPRRTAQQRFDEANTTHDGKLTLEQAQAGKMRRVADNFDAIDTKKRGYVTMADIKAYTHKQRMARKQKQ